MKKVFLILFLFASYVSYSQVQYGGTIRASNNAGTMGDIRRTNNSLQTADSILAARTPALGASNAAGSRPVTQSTETATGNITTQNLVPNGAATANSALEITLNGASSLCIQTTGTYTGALSIQVTNNDTRWETITASSIVNTITGAYSATIASAAVGVFQVEVGGYLKARVTALAAVTGTATVTLRATNSSSLVTIDNALPAGTATIGAVNIAAAQTLATVTTVSTVTTLANGQTANSSASTGNPLRAGGRVVPTTAATQDQTYVAGDAAEMPMTTGAQLIQKPYATAEIDWHYAAASGGIVSTTTAVTFRAASGTAGIRNYITGIEIGAYGAGTATELAIRDGAAGTVIWRMQIPAAGLTAPVIVNFTTPLRGTANTLLEVVTLTGSATPIFFNAHGYTGF